MNITESYGAKFPVLIKGQRVDVLGLNMPDSQLTAYRTNERAPADLKTAAGLLLDFSTVTRVDGKTVRVAKPEPVSVPNDDPMDEWLNEVDDGFPPVGTTQAVALTGQATRWGEPHDNEDTALAVSEHQALAAVSIHPVAIENLPDFDNMQQDIPLNMKKFEFQSVGQELRGLYVGIQKMQKNGKPFDSAVFQRKDGLVWVSGVDLTSKLAPIPTGTPVLVRFQGTKNLEKGNRLSLFDVFSLK